MSTHFESDFKTEEWVKHLDQSVYEIGFFFSFYRTKFFLNVDLNNGIY